MASWMVHFRVADALMDNIENLSPEHFIVGNVAPDSGETNDDGRTYSPSKDISHWVGADKHFRYGDFYDSYLLRENDSTAFSFYHGYYVHLLTDELWAERIYLPAKARFGAEFPDSHTRARAFKRDWYGLDHLFLSEHPDFRAFRQFATIKSFPNVYFDYFPQSAFEKRIRYISDFYNAPPSDIIREYKYLTKSEMDAFVRDTVDTVTLELQGKI